MWRLARRNGSMWQRPRTTTISHWQIRRTLFVISLCCWAVIVWGISAASRLAHLHARCTATLSRGSIWKWHHLFFFFGPLAAFVSYLYSFLFPIIFLFLALPVR
ncbi:hypothetical protein BGY98DRAFT_990560 [Russula aff. rugulosa BPL654]|nr:hypothetical protein BGY98DRAFT_990560 [Russula aff. rugulosa BPL654]